MLDNASCSTGTLDALKLSTYGGVIPGGSSFRTVCEAAVTCASAELILTLGWKNTLTTPYLGKDCDSICSMSLTCVTERALVIIDHALRHVVGRQAVIGPHDRDDGDADIGKDVGRRLHPGRHAEDDDQHRHDHERVGTTEGDANDCEH